jgi:hypothetical protein
MNYHKAEAPGGNFRRSFLPCSAHSKGILSSSIRHINFVERLWEKVIHSSILYAIRMRLFDTTTGKSNGKEAFAAFANDMERQR